MISTFVGMAVGAVMAALLWTAMAPTFDAPSLARANYRGDPLVTGVGVLVPLSMVLLAGASRVLILATDANPSWDQLVGDSVLAAVGFSLLGLFDDVAGVGQSGGFRGHVRALAHGQLTSGMVKLVGGAALGVVVSASLARGDEGVLGALRDGAIIALSANLANLFDRAPGRAVKVSAVAFAVAAVLARSPTLLGPGAGIGAGLGLLPADLRERCMLGDAGANPLGALCGMAALAAGPGAAVRWVLLGALVALNASSEVVSFSSLIDRTPPLRWFDRLGSLRHD